MSIQSYGNTLADLAQCAAYGVNTLLVSKLEAQPSFHATCRVVAATHAAVACACGTFWFLHSGEYAKLEGQAFVFLPVNSYIAAVGASYFLYDTVAMIACFGLKLIRRDFFLSIMGHHFIFVAAYASTLVRLLASSLNTCMR